MVGKVMVMIPVVKVPVEIAQDEEAAEAEPSPPERPGDPIIEIPVCPGGRIIAHDGRSILVIVFLDAGGLHIIGILRTRSGVA
jgi:hypothetical protein